MAWTAGRGHHRPPAAHAGEIVKDEDGSGAKALTEFLAAKKFI